MPEPSGISANDRVALTFLALIGLPTLLGVADVLWGNGIRWLVDHGILVGATEEPLLPIPGLAGAGLDVSRITVVAAVLIILLVLAATAIRRAWLTRHHVTGA